MRVSQCLQMLSETTKQAIVTEQNYRFGQISEPELENRISSLAFLASAWNRFSDLEKRVIRLFLLQAAQGFLGKKQWDRLARREHVHLSHGLTQLRRLGIIYTVRKLWSEIGYIMPQELRENFMSLLLESAETEDKNALVHTGKQTLSYYIPTGRGIQLDVFALLLFLRDFDLPFTQKRTIHRRFLQKLTPLFSLLPEHVAGMAEWLGKDEENPQVSIVLDLAMRLQIVRAEEKSLRLAHAEVAAWLEQPEAARRESILQLLQQFYLPPQPWYEAFAFAMKQHQGEMWLSVDLLLQKLQRAGYDLPENAGNAIARRWLHPLLGFGWIQLGYGEEQRLYWRWNPLLQQSAADGWYIEPTGDVILPPLVPLAQIWEISKFGRISFSGDLLRCELEADKVKAYVGNGGSEQHILAALKERCMHPLPESVTELVRKWAEGARQIRLERVVRVRTANPRLLAELREMPSLQPFLTQVISDTDFLISVEQESALAELLRQYGFEPQTWKAEEADSARQRENAPDGTGLFATQRPWEGYQVENVFPDRYESMPQVMMIPKMWTQHYQTYHPQTLRDLFKRAQELYIEVRVQDQHGTEWQGIPQKVEVEMGYWYVTLEAGRKKLKCRLEDINKVKIVLPEYL